MRKVIATLLVVAWIGPMTALLGHAADRLPPIESLKPIFTAAHHLGRVVSHAISWESQDTRNYE